MNKVSLAILLDGILTVTPTRTFLEKIFLLHEEFSKTEDKVKSERMSRHLYDIERIMRTKYAEQALVDKELYQSIVVITSGFMHFVIAI